MSLFGNHTIDQHANSLASFNSSGEAFAAGYEPGTNLRNLLLGLACELYRVEAAMNALFDDHNIAATIQFITNWENAVGIPDGCIDRSGTLAQRRNNVIAKFAQMNVITAQDFIRLAQLFGFVITIQAGRDAGIFPLSFPISFFPDAKTARFTMIVNFTANLYVFPLSFPINFSSGVGNIIQCLFNKLRPANVQLIYKYQNT